jgi:hypothetical protein
VHVRALGGGPVRWRCGACRAAPGAQRLTAPAPAGLRSTSILSGSGQLALPKPEKRGTTEPQPFSFATDNRAAAKKQPAEEEQAAAAAAAAKKDAQVKKAGVASAASPARGPTQTQGVRWRRCAAAAGAQRPQPGPTLS